VKVSGAYRDRNPVEKGGWDFFDREKVFLITINEDFS
jgi:hypothetical protein